MGAGQSTNGQSSPEIVKLQTEFAEANSKIDSIYKNNNNLATSLDLNTAVLPLAKTADMTNLVQKSDITALTSSFNINNLVQKSDLADVAQKTDLADIAQKCNLDSVAQKTDLAGVAQKTDLAGLGKCNNSNSLDAFDIANATKQIMLGINKDNSISCPINFTELKYLYENREYITYDKNYNKSIDTKYINTDNISGFKTVLGLGDIICAIPPSSVYNVFKSNISTYDTDNDGNISKERIALIENENNPIYRYSNDPNLYANGYYDPSKSSNIICPQNTLMIPLSAPPDLKKDNKKDNLYQYRPMCILNMQKYANEICQYGFKVDKTNNRYYCNPPPAP